jgi:hypothetical protein
MIKKTKTSAPTGKRKTVVWQDVGDEDLYERGPALMPEVPREEDKVVLTPLGDR